MTGTVIGPTANQRRLRRTPRIIAHFGKLNFIGGLRIFSPKRAPPGFQNRIAILRKQRCLH